jgi:predicted nucleic acid-binding protein
VIFLDTSAIYAWADAADPNHDTAVQRLRLILERGEQFLTHNYVLLESTALLQSRLGLSSAIKLAADAETFLVEWVDEALHDAAIRELQRSRKRQLSLVDHVSFLVMKQRNVTTAFAFDPDFARHGFRVFEGQ